MLYDDSININDLLVGDRDVLFLHTMESAYDSKLQFSYGDEPYELDTRDFEIKKLLVNPSENGTYFFKTKKSEVNIEFRLKTIGDEIKCFGKEKIDILKNQIVSINGDKDIDTISKIFDTLPIKDSLEFQAYINEISPGINIDFKPEKNVLLNIPIDFTLYGIVNETLNEHTMNVNNEIFTLVHYGHFSYSDVISMSVFNRRYFINKLFDDKQKQREAEEKQISNMKNKK